MTAYARWLAAERGMEILDQIDALPPEAFEGSDGGRA